MQQETDGKDRHSVSMRLACEASASLLGARA
jgi:hypothetical protein